MALLQHHSSGRQERLTGEHSIGRSSACLLNLSDPRASGHHALLRWAEDGWELLDLGSRNGTWVDGMRLSAGQRQRLQSGMTLGFGRPDDGWTLTESGAPELMARSEAGDWAIADDGLLVLPDADSPLAVVYVDEQGQLVTERGGQLEVLPPELTLEVGEQRWQLHPATRTASTHAVSTRIDTFETLTFAFRVSQDEEDIEIQVCGGPGSITIPHRAQHYLLLTLARARLEDAEEGELPESEQGWRYCDDLYRALRIPENQFNVAIYRARRHLESAEVPGAKRILERRRGSGQIRLGTGLLVIESL